MKAYTKIQLKKYKGLYLFLIPGIVLALIFSYLPMVGLLIAFKDNINFIRYSNPLDFDYQYYENRHSVPASHFPRGYDFRGEK